MAIMYLIYLICNKKKHWWNKSDPSFITLGIFSTAQKAINAMKWARERNGINNNIKFSGIELDLDNHLKWLHPFRKDGFMPEEYQCYKEEVDI